MNGEDVRARGLSKAEWLRELRELRQAQAQGLPSYPGAGGGITLPTYSGQFSKTYRRNGKSITLPGGDKLSQSGFDSYYTHYAGIYLQFLGRKPSLGEVEGLIRNPVSDYALRAKLTKTPGFYKSPVWQASAPNYAAAWQSIYGPKSSAPRGLVRRAIAKNWNMTAFQEKARGLPQYEASEEFKRNVTAMSGVYTSIYGGRNPDATKIVKQATRLGWSSDQFVAWLRQQPEYVNSAEQQAAGEKLAGVFGVPILRGFKEPKAPKPAGGLKNG